MKKIIGRCAKAVVGGAISGLTYLVPVSGDGVSLPDALGTALAFLVGFNGVYWVKNLKAVRSR